MTNSSVLVTGATGYIAKHCIIQLLEAGYHVRGTIRNLSREAELRQIFAKYLSSDEQLEFVEAELLNDTGWDTAMEGCDYVLHTASPNPVTVVEDEMMVIRPALEGTKRVLTAALNAKVKRVVLTSSVAAIAVGHDNKQNFDESDWTQTNKPIAAYPKSKALAERSAWDFVQTNPSLELVSINPSLVVGPILDKQVNASLEPIFRIMKGMYPAMPRIGWNFVDVRDVAAAHIAVLTVPEAAGQRFCCTNDWRWLSDVAKVLDHHYSSKGYRIATGTLPNFVVRLIALFDKSVRMVVGNLGRRVEYDNSQIKKVLKWQPRPVEQSIVDTAQSMIDFNLV